MTGMQMGSSVILFLSGSSQVVGKDSRQPYCLLQLVHHVASHTYMYTNHDARPKCSVQWRLAILMEKLTLIERITFATT